MHYFFSFQARLLNPEMISSLMSFGPKSSCNNWKRPSPSSTIYYENALNGIDTIEVMQSIFRGKLSINNIIRLSEWITNSNLIKLLLNYNEITSNQLHNEIKSNLNSLNWCDEASIALLYYCWRRWLSGIALDFLHKMDNNFEDCDSRFCDSSSNWEKRLNL